MGNNHELKLKHQPKYTFLGLWKCNGLLTHTNQRHMNKYTHLLTHKKSNLKIRQYVRKTYTGLIAAISHMVKYEG